MNALTTILYWLSTGMMIPVVVLILITFGWSLLLLGDLYGIFATRLRSRDHIQKLLKQAKITPVSEIDLTEAMKGKGLFQTYLQEIHACGWHRIHGDKVLSDFELAVKKELKAPTVLMRLGPMLGLMGTLIPMGPALAGLASGDIASMATNMQIAFSTTVVGVFIGAIGFVVRLPKSHWRQSDQAVLAYLYELAQEQQQNDTKKNLCA